MTRVALALAACILIASVFALPVVVKTYKPDECKCEKVKNKCTRLIEYEGEYMKCKLVYCDTWTCVEYGATHICDIETVNKDILVPKYGVPNYTGFKCEYKNVDAYIVTPR
eukprot:CAMPEP_0174908230 /NCGR_PEP_ID=MMETSP0167-20121228/63933_1 /TAXON_ID=38298 /ORGANISM="Rhodella maculata, Strain CCMP736" /LENGTH=110 /DNA_ID=CAMNT_0016151937 /DNA_START=839 /DNA_END=1168 /DNA_ORIENTATION=+